MNHINLFFQLLFILLTSVFISCADKKKESNETTNNQEYVIEGEISNLKKGKILLQQIEGEKLLTKDSSEVGSNGKFKLKVNSPEPDFYVLKINDTLSQLLILDGKNIKISGNALAFINSVKVEGSKATNEYMDFNKKINTFLENENLIKSKLPNYFKSSNLDSIKYIQGSLINAQNQTVNFVKSYIDSVVPSLAVFNFIQYINVQKDFDFIVKLSKSLNAKLPDSKYTKLLNEEVGKMLAVQKKIESSGVAIGAIAPEIILPNQEEKITKLSSFKGKVILLDFWASWCGPCREESPAMVRIYNKFKNKNFEIFGVSLDKDKFSWVNAIKKDQLNWTQVSDLKFWDSAVVPLYNLEGIPATFLIGKDGKVIAKDLRGVELEKKIAEVLK